YMVNANGSAYSLDSFLCFPYEDLGGLQAAKIDKQDGVSGYRGADNPYYDKGMHFNGGGRTFLVTRLDGPSAEIAKELVDRALYGENYITTKYGKAVIDARGLKPPSGYYPMDKDMTDAGEFLKSLGYDTLIDKNEPELDQKCCPGTLWYYGWYSYNKYNDAFTWKVGAVGIHLDSASAIGIRGGSCWVSQSLLRGITATAGAVNEPYGDKYTRANLFFKYLLTGYNFAEASYLATPSAKWMMCFVGDPLYNPSSSAKKQDTVKPNITKLEILKGDDSPDTFAKLFVEADKFVELKAEYGKNKEELTLSAFSDVMKLKHKLNFYDLEASSVYYLKVTCTDSSGNTATKEGSFKTTAPVPEEMKSLKADKADGEIILGWEKNPATDLAGYKLFMMEAGEKVYGKPVELPVDALTYTFEGLVNERTYAFCLRAVNKDGEMSPRAEVFAAATELSAVTNFKIEGKAGGAGLSWEPAKSKSVTGYEIYRHTRKKGNFKKIKSVREPGFVDQGIKKGTAYYYKIVTMGKGNAMGEETEPVEYKEE
ncbi:MAG: TIGR03790 family protein, partial [Candidatus Firestonebacteria bacterium]